MLSASSELPSAFVCSASKEAVLVAGVLELFRIRLSFRRTRLGTRELGFRTCRNNLSKGSSAEAWLNLMRIDELCVWESLPKLRKPYKCVECKRGGIQTGIVINKDTNENSYTALHNNCYDASAIVKILNHDRMTCMTGHNRDVVVSMRQMVGKMVALVWRRCAHTVKHTVDGSFLQHQMGLRMK